MNVMFEKTFPDDVWGATQGNSAHTGFLEQNSCVTSPNVVKVSETTGVFLSAPLVSGPLTFVLEISAGGVPSVVAVDWLEGRERWRHSLEMVPACSWSCGVIDRDSLLVFDAGEVRRLSLNTGRVLNRRDLGEEFFVTSPAVVASGMIYVGTARAELLALDEDLSSHWVVAMSDRVIYSPPAVLDRTLIFQGCGASSSSLAAVSIDNGDVLWKQEGEWAGRSTVSIAGNRVVLRRRVFRRIELAILDGDNGEALWTAQELSESSEEPVEAGCSVAGDRIIACLRPEALEARDTDSGKLLWKSMLAENCRTAPVASTDLVFVAEEEGMVEAFDRQTGRHRWRAKIADSLVSTPAIGSKGLVIVARTGLWKIVPC